MPSRDVLVRPGSELLGEPGTTVLHTYPSGEALVRTTALTEERSAEQGVRLSPELAANLDVARATFGAMPDDDATVILAYLELAGPVARAWLRRIEELGVTSLRFQPVNTYLCRGSVASLKKAAAEAFVLRVTPLTPELKPTVHLPAALTEPAQVWIVAQAEEAARDAVLNEVGALPGVTLDPNAPPEMVDHFLHIPARITPEGEATARGSSRVLAVEVRRAPEPEDEVANLILCGQVDGNGRSEERRVGK